MSSTFQRAGGPFTAAGRGAGFWRACLGLPVSGWCAWQRRRGRYRRRLLGWRWWVFRSWPRPASLLQLALCRRDFGLPLPARWRAPLTAALPSLPPAAARRARDLLAADGGAAHQAMLDRRQAFADWLASRRATGGLCLVGNAAGLRGSALGAHIDAHAAVLRFNRWQPAAADGTAVSRLDVGNAWQVWVLAPDLRQAPPPGLSWAMFSGPDPCVALARWPQAQSLEQHGVPVLTVPLAVWRALVRELRAPPSAGVLVLAWLRELGAGWQGLSSAGIGWGATPQGRHHLLAGHGAGRRHRWDAERALLQRWRAEGLHDLAPLAQRPAA